MLNFSYLISIDQSIKGKSKFDQRLQANQINSFEIEIRLVCFSSAE